jgi:hypothetical protein
MMTQQELTTHIHQKLKTGYTDEEIRKELAGHGYGEAEISTAIYSFEEKKKPDVNPLSIIVSILFIFMGLWRISNGNTTWGTILLAYGSITLVIRLVQLTKN